MIEDNKPLMFINTTNELKTGKQQDIYDSRVNCTTEFREYKKLQNILEMYNKGRPVLCKILTNVNKQELITIGIPYRFEEHKLYVKSTDAKEIIIDEKELKRIFIIRF